MSNSQFFQDKQNRIIGSYIESDLIKGGEGTKGGKVIGHTKSGKAIYEDHNHASHKKFTSQDHAEAVKRHREMFNNSAIASQQGEWGTKNREAVEHHKDESTKKATKELENIKNTREKTTTKKKDFDDHYVDYMDKNAHRYAPGGDMHDEDDEGDWGDRQHDDAVDYATDKVHAGKKKETKKGKGENPGQDKEHPEHNP